MEESAEMVQWYEQRVALLNKSNRLKRLQYKMRVDGKECTYVLEELAPKYTALLNEMQEIYTAMRTVKELSPESEVMNIMRAGVPSCITLRRSGRTPI